MIAKDDLVAGQHYIGEGREGPVAYWTGDTFYSIGCSWGQYEANGMDYGERGFSPYQEVVTQVTPKESGQHKYNFPADHATVLIQAFAHHMERKIANALFMHGGKNCHGNMDACWIRAKESTQLFIDMKVLENGNETG